MQLFTSLERRTVSSLCPPTSRRKLAAGSIGAVAVAVVVVPLAYNLINVHPKVDAPAARPPVATVSTQAVTMAPTATRVSASGSVAARHDVQLGAEVSGLRVIEVDVDEGDTVHTGQVLARLNSDVLQSQLLSLQAQLSEKRAGVSKARQPNRIEDIAGLKAALAQAEAAVKQAEASLDRAKLNFSNQQTTASAYNQLGQEGAVSRQDALDKVTSANMAGADVEAAKQQLEAARFTALQAREHYQMAINGGRKEDVTVSLAQQAQTEASIREIQAQINQTIVRAPSNGLITKRLVEVGQISMSGQAMFSMTRDGEIELQAQVQEVDLPGVRAGESVIITPASTQLASITSAVREVSPRVDQRTRQGTVYIPVPANAGLKAGMYANAVITTGTHQSMIIPTKSVIANDTGKSVFVCNGDRVSQRSVETGTINGEITEVLGGLHPGDKVVVLGAGFLKDGDRVKIR